MTFMIQLKNVVFFWVSFRFIYLFFAILFIFLFFTFFGDQLKFKEFFINLFFAFISISIFKVSVRSIDYCSFVFMKTKQLNY
jgi:hypothetical protein